MRLPDTTSLSATVDAVNDAFFFHSPLSKTLRERTARWIAKRVGVPGSYSNMPAPTPTDYRRGVRVFTGEQRASGAGTGHILGEEACRALILLDVDTPAVAEALARGSKDMADHLGQTRKSVYWRNAPGMFCCGICSVALWRHLAVGGLADLGPEAWLKAGIKTLKAHRTDDNRWQRFPFHYTLSCLCELDVPGVLAELRHAAPSCERTAKRKPKDDMYDRRRRAVAERVLARC